MRTGDAARNTVIALGLVTAACLLLAFAAPQDPINISINERLTAPDSAHWLGCDELGRDILSRVLVGASYTVAISVAALLASLTIGAAIGALAGFHYGRWPDRVFLWLIDLFSSIPFLLIMAALLSAIGPGAAKAYLVLSLVIWPGPARIVRAEVIKIAPLPFITAERAIGLPEWRILLAKILPNCTDTAALYAIAYLPDIVALEAALSFLGLGIQPPQPGLGKMIYDGMNYVSSAPWMLLAPGAMLLAIVVAVRLVAVLLGARPMNADHAVSGV